MYVYKGFYDNKIIRVNSAFQNPPFSFKSIKEFLDYIYSLSTLNENDYEGDFEEITVKVLKEHLNELYLQNADERVS